MAFASTFELRLADGTPADPPTLTTAAPLWRPGDTIPLGARTPRVIEVRDGDDDVGRGGGTGGFFVRWGNLASRPGVRADADLFLHYSAA